MYKFGSRPARSLESFGVSGVLGPECRVFYEALFNTQHVGKVSDLLSARLKKAGFDELRFRTLLLISFYGAYRGNGGPEAEGARLEQPMVLECGIDGEKVAIGVNFKSNAATTVNLNGLQDRIAQGTPQGAFEELLHLLQKTSNRLVLRAMPSAQRYEVVSVLGLPGMMDAAELSARAPIEVVVINQAKPEETPKTAQYTELGDLDYQQLLREDTRLKQLPPSPTGEIMVEHLRKLHGHQTEVKGDEREAERVVKIEGDEPEDLQDDELVTIKSSPESSRGIGRFGRRVRSALSRILPFKPDSLFGRLISGIPDPLEGMEDEFKVREIPTVPELDDLTAIASNPSVPAEDAGSQSAGEEPIVTEEDLAADPVQAVEDLAPVEDVIQETHQKGELPDSEDLEEISEMLIDEIQEGGLDRAISQLEKEAADVKSELKSEKAKRMVDNLMRDLLTEKSNLREMAKKVNLTARQKDLVHKNQMQSLERELRKRDELLLRSNAVLTRTREQVAHSQKQVERLKLANQVNQDNSSIKQKYALMQRMLNVSKEENSELVNKVESLRAQLSSAQMGAKSRGPGAAEFNALQGKYERLYRQYEDYKRANQTLLEKVNDKKERGLSSGGSDDMKLRLDAAMRLSAVQKKEVEQMHARMLKMQREEKLLKAELSRAYDLLKSKQSLQKPKPPSSNSGGGGSSDSGNGSQAA